MRKLIILLCLCVCFVARGQTYNYHYWFDTNEGEQKSGTVTGNSLQLDIPTSGLSDWYHTLHIQVIDGEGNSSPVLSRTFAIVPTNTVGRTPSNYRYWFDSDEANMQTGAMTGNTFTMDVPTEGLTDWFHQMHYQVQDVSGQWSPVLTRTFAIIPTNTADRTLSSYRYWFDSDEANIQTGTMTGNTFTMDVPTEGLSNWFHLLHYQVQDVSGQWSPVFTRTFVIIPQETSGNRDLTGQPYRYWYDDDDNQMQTGTLAGNVLELEAAMDSLSSGVHMFHLQVQDNQGNWSPALSRKFLGGNQLGVILPWGYEWAWESKYRLTEGRSNYAEPAEDANGHKWTEVDYDDSSWQTLTGPMANSSDRFDEVNYIWEGDDNCFNLRRTFQMDSIPEGKYQLLMAHDDGVKVYLNGQQVVDDASYGMSFTYDIPQSAFVVGENILAIYVEENSGNQYLDYCLRYVETTKVKSITLNENFIELAGGKRFMLKATVLPEEVENKAVTWTVANDGIASVSQNGVVCGLKKGITTVTVASVANPKITATCTVNVTSDKQESVVNLPDIAFEFFYDAADYDEATHSIPNHPKATLADWNMQLTADLPEYDGEQLIINGNCQGYIDKWPQWATESGAYFYRHGQDNMTIIAKVKPKLDAESCDFISNRGGGYNYMFRVGNRNRFYLHTADAYDEKRSILFGNDSAQVIVARANGVENYIQIDNLTTGETLRYEGVNWGGNNNVFNFFNNCGSEYYHGGFYWAYYSFEYLQDDEVNAVVAATGSSTAPIAEPYAVLSNDNTMLTFYYDDQKEKRNGMDVGPFDKQEQRPWNSYCMDITTVEFDASFADCTSLASTSFWFSHCEVLTTINGLNNLNTVNITDMGAMFYYCYGLTSLDLSTFNTANVTNMSAMFENCSYLTHLDVSSFNTAKVTNMARMFFNCNRLPDLNVSNFNTANVEYMEQMFYGCTNLTELDVSNFSTDNVVYMDGMFYYCPNLKTIYVGDGWTTNKVVAGKDMFTGCTVLVGGNGTVYDGNHTDYTYAHIDGGSANPGYFTPKNGYGMAATPVFTYEDNKVYITSATEGATIHYTLDGTTPDAESPIYSDALTMTSDCTIKAIAMKDGYTPSAVTSYEFHAENVTVATPQISSYNNKIGISTATEQAVIHYTLDGTEPTAESAVYSDSITVTENCTVKAIALRENWFDSQVATFEVDWFKVADVTFVQNGNQIILSTTTEGAIIYYSLDGSEPGIKCEDVLTMTGDCTITALATKDGYTPSATTTYEFHADGVTVATPVIARNGNRIGMSTTTELATIHYTLDGTEPTAESAVYGDSITVTENCTVKAIALRENWFDSEVATFEVDWFVAVPPTIALSYNGREVTMTSDAEDASIFYTLNGSEPTVESLKYEGEPVRLTDLCTVKAFATAEGREASEVSTLVVHGLFDGVTAHIGEGGSIGEAFQWCGGIVGAENLAAIIWSRKDDFPADAAASIQNPNLLLYVSDYMQALRSGIQNVVADGMAQRITLTDNVKEDGTRGPAAFFVPRAFRVQNEISYTHTYSQTTQTGECRGWETIALPFDVQTITHETNGDCVPFRSYSAGKKPFWLCRLTEQGFVDADSIRAGIPYIISMPNSDQYSPYYRLAGKLKFVARGVTVPASRPQADQRGDYRFVPAFCRVAAADTVYALNVGEERYGHAEGSIFISGHSDVYPFQAYRTAASAGVRYLSIADELGGNATQGIEAFGIERKDGTIYNLQGLPVEAMGKGVYIRNRKKIINH